MRILSTIGLVLFLTSGISAQKPYLQMPEIIWSKNFGGSEKEYVNKIIPANDGNFLISGYTYSDDIDVYKDDNSTSIWIMEINLYGDTLQKRTIGGGGAEECYDIIQTKDGGYALTGFTSSTYGDIQRNFDGDDVVLIKLDKELNIEWYQAYGGSEDDFGVSLVETQDGYLILASTASHDNQVHNNHSNGTSRDYWAVRVNTVGDTIWTRCYGNEGSNDPKQLVMTADSNYILFGLTFAGGGMIHNFKDNADYWAVKIDSAGDTLWTNCYGGSMTDNGYGIAATEDSGFVMTGRSLSNNFDVTHHYGSATYADAWTAKGDINGDLIWNRSMGTTGSEHALAISKNNNEDFLICGLSYGDNGIYGSHGDTYDYFIAGLNADGDSLFQRCLGGNAPLGSHFEQAKSIAWAGESGFINKGFIVAGDADSDDGDVPANYGETDWWVALLKSPCLAGKYLFSGNADDSTGNEYHGTFFGTSSTNDRFGNADKARYFDGTDDYMVIPDSGWNNPGWTGAGAWEFWFKKTGNWDSTETLLSFTDGSKIIEVSLNPATKKVEYLNSASWGTLVSVDTVVANRWTHLMVTIDGWKLQPSGIYVNGVFQGATDTIYVFPPDSTFVGSSFQGSHFFEGIIDEFRIYNCVPDSFEIAARYERTKNPCDSFTLEFDSQNPTCSRSNGYLTAIPSGGIEPYSYQWSNGLKTASINSLTADTFFVEVTDNMGCSITDTVILTSPGAASIN